MRAQPDSCACLPQQCARHACSAEALSRQLASAHAACAHPACAGAANERVPLNDQGYLLPFWQRLLLRSTYVLLCTAVACIIVSRGAAAVMG